MRKNEMTWSSMIAEAIGIVSAVVYVGLQIYYGILYGVSALDIALNVVAMILVYAGLTLLLVYPERVNGLRPEVCTGKVRKLTRRMLRAVKLFFVLSLLFASICDVLGKEVKPGYSVFVVIFIVLVALFYEVRIIKILRKR